jgi:serine/threonine protein kinase
MPYTCPEIIQQEQYTEKADVWSLGCVLYHMMALRPPFDGTNPLSVASRIVEGSYDAVSAGNFGVNLGVKMGVNSGFSQLSCSPWLAAPAPSCAACSRPCRRAIRARANDVMRLSMLLLCSAV